MPVRAAADDTARVPAFQVEFLMPREGACGSGLRPVSADRVFRTGDRFRLRLAANFTGNIYVVVRGSEGDTRVLFPPAGGAADLNWIERGENRVIPEDGWFRFDAAPGMEQVFVFWAAGSVPALERALAKPNSDIDQRDFVDLLARAHGRGPAPGLPWLRVQSIRLNHASRSGELCPAPVSEWRRADSETLASSRN